MASWQDLQHRLERYYLGERQAALGLALFALAVLTVFVVWYRYNPELLATGALLSGVVLGMGQFYMSLLRYNAQNRRWQSLRAPGVEKAPLRLAREELEHVRVRSPFLRRQRQVETLLGVLGIYLMLQGGVLLPNRLVAGLGIPIALCGFTGAILSAISSFRTEIYQEELSNWLDRQ